MPREDIYGLTHLAKDFQDNICITKGHACRGSLNGGRLHVLGPLHWARNGFVRAYQACVRPRLGCQCLLNDINSWTIALRPVDGAWEQRVDMYPLSQSRVNPRKGQSAAGQASRSLKLDHEPFAPRVSPWGSGGGSVLACMVLGPWGANHYKDGAVPIW